MVNTGIVSATVSLLAWEGPDEDTTQMLRDIEGGGLPAAVPTTGRSLGKRKDDSDRDVPGKRRKLNLGI